MPECAVCPRCGGERQIHNARSGQMEPCPTCDGTGVKWRDEVGESAPAIPASDDPRDLTYRT